MSVPTWRRHLSRTQFLYDIFQLNILVGNIVANAPIQKYLHSYGNTLIVTAQQALLHAQTGNKIYAVDDTSFYARRTQFQLCIGCVENISTVAYIYLEIMRKHDGIKPQKCEKMYRWENEIGDQCNLIINRLHNVMKTDKESYGKKGKTGV